MQRIRAKTTISVKMMLPSDVAALLGRRIAPKRTRRGMFQPLPPFTSTTSIRAGAEVKFLSTTSRIC